MSRFIPPQASKRYTVLNRGDIFGDIVETRNMDFSRRGYMSLASKPYSLMTETINADFETPLAILMDDDDVFVVTSEDVFSIDPTTADLTISAEVGGTPPGGGFQADGVFFNGELHVSDTTGIHSLNAGTWAQDYNSLSSSYPHPLCVSEHQQYLAAGNGNTVVVMNTSYVVQATMTVPSDHVITWIRWRSNFLWCGSRNIQGGEAKVFVWNGSGTAAQASYGVGGDWAFSGCVYPGTIVVVSSTGQVLRFAGDDFVPFRLDNGEEVAFPCYWANRPWGSSSATSNLLGKISSRGMEAKGRLIYMMVDSTIEGTNGGVPEYLSNFPSGLWVLDPSVGLYHKSGCDHLQRQSVAVSSYASDVLTIASAAVFETGDPVHLVNNVTMTGVDDLIYYAIKTDSTHLKLARTPREAKAGTACTIGGTADGELLFNVYESSGSVKFARGGGLAVIRSLAFARYNGIEVIWGADTETATGSAVGSVMSLGMGRNEGFAVFSKILAQNLTDKFKKIIAKFKPLNLTTWEIEIKYRIEDRWGLPGRMDFDNGNGTWVNDTSFTINPTTYDVGALAVGDEVQFLGRGAGGFTRHVSAITVNSATQWTITIDEAVPDISASDTCLPLFDNWTKYRTISTVDDAKAAAVGLKKMLISKDAKWVQLKILLRGFTDITDAPDFEEVMLLTGADQKYA